MPTLNFLTREQRRNVINMPSRDEVPPTRLHIAHCRQVGCTFAVSARSDSAAIRSLCAHIVTTHQPPSTDGNDNAA